MARKQRRSEAAMAATETKQQKFIRVVTPRVNRAFKAITLIGNCAGSAYEYTPEQVGQMIGILSKALDEINLKFTSKAQRQSDFVFGK